MRQSGSYRALLLLVVWINFGYVTNHLAWLKGWFTAGRSQQIHTNHILLFGDVSPVSTRDFFLCFPEHQDVYLKKHPTFSIGNSQISSSISNPSAPVD